MTHSYEEIRSVALDIMAGRAAGLTVESYDMFGIAVAEVFAKRELTVEKRSSGVSHRLDPDDEETFLEVFWDFFRQGFLTIGSDYRNREFPWFRITKLGRQISAGGSGYFFHDVSSYEQSIRTAIPNINSVTLLYLKEAMQAFQAGCILSATTMLGVAAEHTFNLLVETLENNPLHQPTFAKIFKERQILTRLNLFWKISEQKLPSYTPEIKEDLATRFLGIQSIIRESRNEAGHPTGKIADREQTFVLLQLFIPYCKKLYQLISFYN